MAKTIANLKSDIISIMDEFKNSKKVFSNESQFQLDLASKIKEKGYGVELEVFATKYAINEFPNLTKKDKNKKQYIDIVVNLEEKKCVVIELKYKTQERTVVYDCGNNKKAITFAQGAPDEGSYLFWKDVVRLERYKSKEIKINFDDPREIVGGLAIIMANDKTYWEGKDKPTLDSKKGESLFYEFFPKHKNKFFGKLCCYVKVDKAGNRVSGRTAKGKFDALVRVDAKDKCEKFNAYKTISEDNQVKFKNKPVEYIELNTQKPYSCEWVDYLTLKGTRIDKKAQQRYEDYEFKYLIVEV
ncbi:MAG: hypothetical protein IKD36_02730 [Clostridia bacterium]|nr:hypothetical protein [Clostridia bacterium]